MVISHHGGGLLVVTFIYYVCYIIMSLLLLPFYVLLCYMLCLLLCMLCYVIMCTAVTAMLLCRSSYCHTCCYYLHIYIYIFAIASPLVITLGTQLMASSSSIRRLFAQSHLAAQGLVRERAPVDAVAVCRWFRAPRSLRVPPPGWRAT